jgi:HK97 family phage prohead protease
VRSIRGLYVIRSGAPVVARPIRADQPAGDPPADDAATADDGLTGDVLELEFSRFGVWYEIDSFWEGRFLERTQRGAFRKTIAERGSQMKVLFNHGFDFNIGDKVLGVPEVLEERETSPYAAVPLLDTSYNRDLVPGLRAGAYGSSFMFEVLGESWNREPEKSEHNPEGLPERTITEVRLFEAGPVTWPANPEATAGLRSASGTDWLMERLAERDPDRREEQVRSWAGFRAMNGLRTGGEPAATPGRPDPSTPASGERPDRHVEGMSAAARRRRLVLIDMAR